MEQVEFIERAISVPFLERGRTFDGWDCWGLVFCAYRALFGVTVPSYAGRYENSRDFKSLLTLFSEGMAEWRRLPDGVKGPWQVAVIYRRGRPIHAGLIVGNGRNVMHAEEGVGTVIEPARLFRIEGVYAWR